MKKIAIIGASHAGVICAEKLREFGFVGLITLIDRIPGLPIQRPPLSKAFIKSKDSRMTEIYLRSEEFYKRQNIHLMTGNAVQEIKRETKSVIFENGSKINYDILILAVGADAKLPTHIPKGTNNIHVLRDINDAVRLRDETLHGNRAVIIGGGYIGLEVASSLRSVGLSVDLIEVEQQLLSRISSQYVSEYLKSLHQKKGVSFHFGQIVEDIVFSKSKQVQAVKLSSGYIIKCDLMVFGIGVSPNIKLAKDLGLSLSDGVRVDKQYLAEDNIYAIGDIALCPERSAKRIESVFHAQFSATVAAASITNSPMPALQAFWFWSEQYDVKLQIAGILPELNSHKLVRSEVRPGKKEGSFSVWSWYQNKLVCVEALGDIQAYMMGKRFLEQSIYVPPETVKGDIEELKKLFEKASQR